MELIKIGDRIAIILKTDNRTRNCFLLGYGIYEGKFIPPANVPSKKGKKFHNEYEPTDRFLCDDGNIYWMYESWIMSEDNFKAAFVNDCYDEGWKVINVDIKGKRRKC